MQWLIALALLWAPYDDRARVQERAVAISRTSARPEEALALLVIDFFETTLGRSGTPYGITCCHNRHMTLVQSAERALRVLRDAYRQCTPQEDRLTRQVFGYFHSGRCRRDVFSDREFRFFNRYHNRVVW